MPEKDRELLDSRLSPHRTDGILELITRLKRELAKGEAVYTADELNRLTARLEECEFLLERLNIP